MKKIFLMSALAIATFGMMNAQNAPTPATQTAKQLPQVRAKAMVSKINNASGLQGDQFTKLNNLYIDYYTKLDALGTDAAKIKDLDNATNSALQGILSPSQLKFWQEAASK